MPPRRRVPSRIYVSKQAVPAAPAPKLFDWEKCIEPGSWNCGSASMGMTKEYAYRKFDSGWHRIALPPAPGVDESPPPLNSVALMAPKTNEPK